jgi:hypothetical protein
MMRRPVQPFQTRSHQAGSELATGVRLRDAATTTRLAYARNIATRIWRWRREEVSQQPTESSFFALRYGEAGPAFPMQ